MQPLASACHWPSATRSIEAGLDARCDRINLPFASSIPLPTIPLQTSRFAHLHRTNCVSQTDLVAADTANVIAAQLRHLLEPTVTNPRPHIYESHHDANPLDRRIFILRNACLYQLRLLGRRLDR